MMPSRDPTDSGARGMVAIPLKEGLSAKEFRQAAAASSDANQARRLLALAAIRDGMSRQAAARIGGMDRQTLRDWVHAFNKGGMEGLINDTSPGRPSKLSVKQKAALKGIVEEGPDLARDGVVRWRLQGSGLRSGEEVWCFGKRRHHCADVARTRLLPYHRSAEASPTEERGNCRL